ncbi:type II secretion system F family protein [Myxococcus sp. MISCRS1]|jgi:tight adherence protein B|uniref:type II secretion system F family protein n=1 Tax=Myxococcus TaxID=32 RepID=UPI001141F2D8|nr:MULTISPECIES: type II secretion system F family protein [Myxococcus]BDT35786.1 type II secretion system F family protein [Myxococcus sp. MH1]MBZ4401364.1 type II secretion system F family protein [Myxococcus sp. AS-1-15]MBZ4414144.1 type II secretion system F family protein [Myxococcus sp. XM-1-1-1]MCK8503520.1 type II secretion system F family protein [Myxococcus fulvus]MCY1002645.1 type II secretion system F family protein [Myxococcus sp. MISCRS1]
MLAGIVLLLVTGSVFFFSLVIFSVLSKAYEQYQERYVAKSMNDLSDMFLFIDARQMLVLNIASMCLLGILTYIIFNPILAVIATVFGFFLPMIMVKHYRKRRIKKFNVQLVDALQAMANAFKAGLTFPQAIEHVAREAMPPLSQEFGLFVKEVKLGVPLEEALINMGRRVGSDDLELVVVSTNIARQLGGNMAEMFETISTVIRERFRLEGKIDALTSQGKLQGWIVAAMPGVLGMVLNYMRPDLMEPMMNHYFGWILVVLIAIMEVMGILIIRRIVNIDI